MKVIKLADTPEQQVIETVIQVLKKGGLVIFPTETTYGAGVDATNSQGVEKLLQYKSRREGKPLSIAVADQKMARRYVEINQQANQLYQQFLPGPVTIISKGLGQVAPGVESEFGTLGVRIPDYELVRKIVDTYGRPMTATSANASGKKRPYALTDIWQNLSQKQLQLVDLALDAGQLPPHPPSTVIDTTLSTPTIFRQGQLLENDQSKSKSQIEYISASEKETKNIAGKICLQHWQKIKDQGLVIGLNGSLGTGKTIFTKGVAQFLQITDLISSPTYSYIEEHHYNRHGFQGTLYHLDVWKVDSATELELLKPWELTKPQNVVVIEWWNQIAPWAEKMKIKANLVVDIEETQENQRKLKLT